MEEFIGVLKNNPNGAYDFICNNYHNMSKTELKDAVKELLYAVHANVTKTEHDKILNDAAEELKDIYKED